VNRVGMYCDQYSAMASSVLSYLGGGHLGL